MRYMRKKGGGRGRGTENGSPTYHRDASFVLVQSEGGEKAQKSKSRWHNASKNAVRHAFDLMFSLRKDYLCESRARALLQYVEEVELNREGGSVPQTYS
jgi:hypothetical protein